MLTNRETWGRIKSTKEERQKYRRIGSTKDLDYRRCTDTKALEVLERFYKVQKIFKNERKAVA